MLADEDSPLEVNPDMDTQIRVFARCLDDGKVEVRAEIWVEYE